MLVLRTAIRSRPGFHVISAPTRWYRATPRLLYQPLVEPYTWRTRLWYRPDGTPRSKWKGAFFATAAFTLLALITSLQETLDEIYLLSLLVQMQRVDTKFSLYDLAKPADLLSYLSEIMKYLPNEEKTEDFETFHRVVKQLMEIMPELHGLLRDELEKLHKIITQDMTQDPLDTAEAVLQALTDLSGHLTEMLQKAQGISIASKEVIDVQQDEDDMYEVVG